MSSSLSATTSLVCPCLMQAAFTLHTCSLPHPQQSLQRLLDHPLFPLATLGKAGEPLFRVLQPHSLPPILSGLSVPFLAGPVSGSGQYQQPLQPLPCDLQLAQGLLADPTVQGLMVMADVPFPSTNNPPPDSSNRLGPSPSPPPSKLLGPFTVGQVRPVVANPGGNPRST